MGLVIAVATIASYGAIWWIAGFRIAGSGSAVTDALGALRLVALLVAAWRRRQAESPERRRERAQRGYIIGLVTGVLGVVILAAVKLLDDAGRLDFLAPVVAILVGLHFLAFARLFPARIYYLTSALLVALGGVGAFLPTGEARVLGVSLSAAVILWLTCVAVLIRPESRRRPPTPAPGRIERTGQPSAPPT